MTQILHEDRWKYKKFAMLAEMMIFPVVGVYCFYQRNWESMAASSVANCMADLVCMFVLLLIFANCIKRHDDNSYKTGYFALLISHVALALLLDLGSWCVNDIPKYSELNMFINTLYYTCGVGVPLVFWSYAVEVSDSLDPRIDHLTRILNVAGAIQCASILGNLYGHYYFYINQEGTYIRCPHFYLSNTFFLVMMICVAILILGMNVANDKKWALIGFIILPTVAMVMQILLSGSSFAYVGATLAMIVIYGNVFTEQSQELANQKIAFMRSEHERLIAKNERQRLDTELNLAAQIQAASLPSEFPAFPDRNEFSLYATMDPAREVGGDFYDFFFIDEDHLALVIADVSGKGVPASLYMMICKIMLKNAALQGLSPSEVLDFVNQQLCENDHDLSMFVTVWIGILDIPTGKLVASNAGHEYPALYRKGGKFELFKDKHSLVLGCMEGIVHKQYELQLEEGDTLFLYTDGVTEATDSSLKLYGTKRMLQALNQRPEADPEKLLKNVRSAIDTFVGDYEQADDITMLALTFLKKDNEVFSRRMHVIPTMESIPQVEAAIENLLNEANVPVKIVMKINIVVDEIYSNIVKYSGANSALVKCKVKNGRVELVFSDNGIHYNPNEAKTPDVTKGVEERQVGGLGIYITKSIMDEFRYTYANSRNMLYLMKKYE